MVVDIEGRGDCVELQIEFLEAKTGDTTLKINEYFIHSKYNPKQEAVRNAELNYTPHHVHVVFGYGCGHLVEALIEIRAFNEAIIVIDPLFNDDVINKPENHERVYYFNTDVLPYLEYYISDIDRNNRILFKAFCLSNYDKLFPELYKTMLQKVKDLQNRNAVNDFTLIRYADSWYNNFVHNMFHLQRDYSGKLLEKAYDVGAVVVAGGPSLQKQMPLLKQYRKHFLIICAGSTINSLIAEGIEPDYAVTIDGGDPNYQHFKNVKLNNTKVVYTMFNHPLVRNSFENDGYIVDTKGNESLTKYIKQKLHMDLPVFLGGASVAHTAYNFAKYITTGPVALIGQDLAYTDNLTHARTNKFAREIDEAFIKKVEGFKVTSYDGEQIWTNPVLNSMRLEFEDLLKMDPPGNLVYNCTEGGVKIEGFQQIPFKQFCETYKSKEEVELIEHPKQLAKFNIIEQLECERKNYKELINILNEAIYVVTKAKRHNFFDSVSLKQLDRLDKKIKKITNEVLVDILIVPTVLRILRSYLPTVNETEQQKFDRTYTQMNDLYRSMKSAIERADNTLKNLIEKRK